MGASNKDEWISAIEAAKLVAPQFGGLTRAKHALALGLREGLLSAAAEGRQIAEGDQVEPTDEDAPEGELFDIDRDLWSQSAIWDSDRLGWDWTIGAFDIATDDSSYAFLGVHFVRSEIEAVDAKEVPYSFVTDAAAVSKAPKPIAQRAKYWDWERALAALVAVAHFDGLDALFGDLGKRGNQQKLEKWLEDWFRNDRQTQAAGGSREVPSEGELRKRAQFVAAAVRSRAGP